MRLLGLEIRRAQPLSPIDGGGGWRTVIREPFAGAWQRNREWSRETVLAHHAVYACVTRIAQDIGKLRPTLVERDEDGIWTEVESPAFSGVLARPNRFQNHIQFKEWWTTAKLLNGNAYVLLERDARQTVRAQYVLDPTRVRVLVAPDGEVFYELRADNLAGLQRESVAVPASEIVHDRINCLYHPLVGTSPLFASGSAANVGLQIQEDGAVFFGNGSKPSGILSTAVAITPAKSKELSEIWNTQFTGEHSGRVAVLGDGMKFEPMRMTAVDAQLIEQLKWSAEVVCSAFHVPPFKIGVGQAPTYQNGEILNGIYYSDCLQSHIEAWELCQDEAFGFTTPTGGKQLGVELDLDGLLRMDGATQVRTLTEGIKGALYTPNEARRKVDQKPLPGGDTVYLQQQNYSIAALDARDRQRPPPNQLTTEPKPPAEEPTADAGREALALAIRYRTRRARIAAHV